MLCGLTLFLTCPAHAQNDYPGSTGYTVTYSTDPVAQGKSFDSQDTLSNPVTATLTWHGDGPAPAVIVEEDATASWFIDGGGTGTCSCGLPNPTHVEYLQDAYDTATRYTIYPAPPSGTITLPTVTTSGSTTLTPGEETDNFVNLFYSVTPTPVILTLGGTTKDSGKQDNILIGQGCTGTLTAGAATLSDFQWTIPGETFASFEVVSTPSSHYGRVHPVDASEYQKFSPHWFWKRGDDLGLLQTVSCTAQASINNVPIGTVTGKRDVLVWRPYFKFNAVPQGVNIVGTPGVPGVDVVGNINWYGSVGTPDLFRSYWGSTGIWQMTQLCNLYRYAPPPVVLYVNTGGPVLDAEFNYSSKQGAPWLADSTDAAPDQQVVGDAPSQGIFARDNVTINDSFQAYMMYQPPGNDIQWAPLNKMDWTWQCNLNYVTTPGQPSHYNPNPPGTITVLDNAATYNFPTWEDYYPDTSGS